MGIIESIIGIIGISSAAVAVGAGATTAVSALSLIYGVVYGGYSICKSFASSRKTNTSPTYNGTLQTQVNNQLPIAIIYGENKVAGNIIWQQLNAERTRITKTIALCEGEIDSISDIRLNDIPVTSLSGSHWRYSLGLAQLQLSSVVPGDSWQEKVNRVGSLKNLAFIDLDVKFNSNISANFNTTAIVRGKKVRVYTSVNNYTVKYSSNPAWCLLDFLTAYNGCAIGLNEGGSRNNSLINELIDIDSFIKAAAFCDQIVDGKPRFSFNMVFDTQGSRRDMIEEFKKSCRGALVMKGKQLQFKIDCSGAPFKSFGPSDIIAGSEQITTIPTEENFDRIIIKYRSKNNEWAIVETYAEREFYDNIPPIEHTVEIYSVLEHAQATRLAWYYLNKVNLERTFGYFETDYRAFDLEIGDIITLSDNLMNYKNKLVKVTRLADKNDGTFGVFWREYNPSLYLDTPASLAPTITETNNGDIFAVPADVEYFHIAQNQNLYLFSWCSFEDKNLTYEIRTGKSWEDSNLVAEGLTRSPHSAIIRNTGLNKFFIKAKSDYGIYSRNASVYTINISDIPSLNIIAKQDLLKDLPESTENCRVYKNILKLSPADSWKASDGVKWTSEGYYALEGKWGAKVFETGYFQTQAYDLGDCINSFVSMDYSSNEKEKFHNVNFYCQYSSDGEVWEDWRAFSEEQRQFRYYRLKINLLRRELQHVYVNKAVFSADVEDRDEYYKNVEILDPSAGALINFAQHPQSARKCTFCAVPSVVANVSDETNGFCVVSEKSKDSCRIKVYNTDSTAIATKIDVHVKGY